MITVADQKLLQQGLEALNLSLPEPQRKKMLLYLQLIQHWNKTHNLTAIESLNEMVVKHLFDSLSILNYIEGEELLDVGSGAGLPGIPLAIADSLRQYHLLDANQKRIAFLKQVKRQLALDNVIIYQARAEQFTQRTFPCITSRAFSSLETFIRSTEQLLNPGGCWLAMKGNYPSQEVEKLPPTIVMRSIQKLAVPKLDAERHLLCLQRRVD